MIPNRSRRVVGAFALTVALLVAIAGPLGYALIRSVDETAMLSLRARLNAGRLGKYIYANERVWRYQAVRLIPLIEETGAGIGPIYQRLTDERDALILEDGPPMAWPVFCVRVPIEVGGRAVAFLEVAVSQRPLLIETAVVALLAGLLGFAAWLAVRLLPLRALDRAMRDLVEQTTRVQAATHEADLLRERERVAAAANAAKSGFLAMMSHEIRTPMNAVLGLAGTLLDNPLPPSQRRVVEAIRDSGDGLLRILNDILDFSKLDARKMVLEEAPFCPETLVNGVASILGSRAAAKGLRIVSDCDPSLPPGLLGDAGRIRQVLINLMSNAVKFTAAGQVTLSARRLDRGGAATPEGRLGMDAQGEGARGEGGPGEGGPGEGGPGEDAGVEGIGTNGAGAKGPGIEWAEIEWVVSDTGIGIAPDRVGSLFSEFMQADNSISRRFGGTGLGLAISKRLIDQMDGAITVESTPGRGTSFRVRMTLPVAERPLEETRRPGGGLQAFEALLATLGRTPRVLFAEDNPTNQFVARELLKDLNLQVDMVGDGLEAVEAASRFAYDVICMDMQMPEMDGLAATRLIRARGGRLATVPIIALTANAFPEDVRACLDAGMNQFVAKPVSREVLLTALQLALLGGSPADAATTGGGSVGAGGMGAGRMDAAAMGAGAVPTSTVIPAVAAPVEPPAPVRAMRAAPVGMAPPAPSKVVSNMFIVPPVVALPVVASPADVALDAEAMEGLTKALGPEGVADMVALFGEDTRERLETMAAKDTDAKSRMREAHSIKGSAATVGAVALSRAASDLEQRLKAGGTMEGADLDTLRRLFGEYRTAVDETMRCAEPAD